MVQLLFRCHVRDVAYGEILEWLTQLCKHTSPVISRQAHIIRCIARSLFQCFLPLGTGIHHLCIFIRQLCLSVYPEIRLNRGCGTIDRIRFIPLMIHIIDPKSNPHISDFLSGFFPLFLYLRIPDQILPVFLRQRRLQFLECQFLVQSSEHTFPELLYSLLLSSFSLSIFRPHITQ